MRKRELVDLLNPSSWCLMVVEWLFLAVPWGCLRFVIVVFPDQTHLLFWRVNDGHEIHHSRKSIFQYFPLFATRFSVTCVLEISQSHVHTLVLYHLNDEAFLW